MLPVSCEYYDYYHFEHHFCENVKFGTTKYGRDSREEALSKKRKRRKSWKWGKNLQKETGVSFVRKLEEFFEKISGNLGKSFKNCEENFKIFKFMRKCAEVSKKI